MSRNFNCFKPLAIAIAVSAALFSVSQASYAQSGSSDQLSASSSDNSASTIVLAETIEGSQEKGLTLKGNAEVRRNGTTLKGDVIEYSESQDTIKGIGNTEISQNGATITAPEFEYRMDSKSGTANNAEFEYAPIRLRGEANCIRFQSTEGYELEDSIVTTCRKGDNSWYFQFDKLTIDQYNGEGYGKNVVLKVGDVPVFGAPYFEFPASGQRKSGLLIPSMGYSKKTGLDMTLPYYFNLAPNYDYTLTPRIMSKNGLMLGNDFRWLTSSFNAEIIYNFIRNDKLRRYRDKDEKDQYNLDSRRYGLIAQINGSISGIGYGIDYNRVSDDRFWSDYSVGLDRDADTDNILDQKYWLTYGSTYWNAKLSVEKNQTIYSRLSQTSYNKPYEKVPEFSLTNYVADFHGFELSGQVLATKFKNSINTYVYHDANGKRHTRKTPLREGDRFVFDESISYPLRGAAWFFTPKAQLVATSYKLDTPLVHNGDKTPSRVVPIFSVDTGLTFERDVTFGSTGFTQTLEPRIFYTYIPHRDQSDIPNFDSSLSELSFGSIFQENRWTSYDRFYETKDITAAITTRFLANDTGDEWFRATIGQQYHFKTKDSEERREDMLLSIGAKLHRTVSIGGFGQYSLEDHDFKRGSAGIRWSPKPMSVVGLYYRYNKVYPGSDSNMHQLDLSTQWPIYGNLNVVGRLNWSMLDDNWIEAMAGFEYLADCWALRLISRRYASGTIHDTGNTKRLKYDNAILLQFELRGLGSLGSNPFGTLQKGIPGFQTRDLNRPASKQNTNFVGPVLGPAKTGYNYYK